MANKKKTQLNGLLILVRFLVFLALGLLAVVGYSLIVSLDFDFKIMIFIGLAIFVATIILLDIFTPLSLISKKDIDILLPKKRR